MIMDDEAVFVGTESAPPLTSYSMTFDDRCSVLGHPSLDDNPAYYGHYANDGASAGEGSRGEGSGVEDSIARYREYMLESVRRANATFRIVRDSHIVTVATKNIRAGEEVLVT